MLRTLAYALHYPWERWRRNKAIEERATPYLPYVEKAGKSMNPEQLDKVMKFREGATAYNEAAKILKEKQSLPNQVMVLNPGSRAAKLRKKHQMAVRASIAALQNVPIQGAESLSDTELQEVIYAAKMANLAYELANPNFDVSKEFPRLDPLVEIWDFTRGPTATIEGFVAYDRVSRKFVVSFKGTNITEMSDVAADLKATSSDKVVGFNGVFLDVPLEGHKGFFERFTNLYGMMLENLSQMLLDYHDTSAMLNPSILFTGHSLGGAVATVAAFVFGQFYPNYNIKLITFESPRVFKKDTVDMILHDPVTRKIEENAIRISSSADPVPDVPPIQAGYLHVGRNYYIPEASSSVAGRHFINNVINDLEEIEKLDKVSRRSKLQFTTGRGLPKRKKRQSSAAMKARMAYVRSFRKKK